MNRLRAVIAYQALLLVALGPCSLDGWAQQHDHGMVTTGTTTAAQDSVVAAFVEEARAATAKYRDLNTAIGAGYRLVGPDFPGMGEHWVHTRRVVQRTLSVARPAVLSYLRIEGEPVLTGVAYAQPVQQGEEPPPFILPGLWHYHAGSIDEETLLLNPQSMHHGSDALPRLAMFHAWIWVDNPDGLFAQDNWALPFLRLGLPVPEAVPPQAGKALFLLTDGVVYYAQLVDVAGSPDEADRAAVEAVLVQYRARVQTRYAAMQAAGVVTEQDLEDLVACWHELWRTLEDSVSPALWAQIKMLAG